jgi:hypothetical protein
LVCLARDLVFYFLLVGFLVEVLGNTLFGCFVVELDLEVGETFLELVKLT